MFSQFKSQKIPVFEYDAAFNEYELYNSTKDTSAVIDVSWISCSGYDVISRTNQENIYQHGKNLDNHFCFVLPGNSTAAFKSFSEHPEGVCQNFYAPPSQEGHWYFGANQSFLTMSFSLSKIETLLTKAELEERIEKSHLLKRNALDKNTLINIARDYEAILNRTYHQHQTNELEEHLDTVALQVLQLFKTDKLSCHQSFSNRIFRRAIEFIKCNFHRQITIVEIADYANTTVRNLQYHFKAATELTPLQFVKAYRFNQLFKQLPHSRTIESAAFSCGLNHMGRLSSEYRQSFSHKPYDRLKSIYQPRFYSWLNQHPAESLITAC